MGMSVHEVDARHMNIQISYNILLFGKLQCLTNFQSWRCHISQLNSIMSYGYLWPLIQLKVGYWAHLQKDKILLGRQYLLQNIHFTSCKACKKSNAS